jgi:CHAT domain-containing protein
LFSGEGIFGLHKAFERAGAQAVVSAQWDVDEELTTVLIKEFYNLLWKEGLSVPEALRGAQLKLIRGHSLDSDHPRYWAAWGATGQWRLGAEIGK